MYTVCDCGYKKKSLQWRGTEHIHFCVLLIFEKKIDCVKCHSKNISVVHHLTLLTSFIHTNVDSVVGFWIFIFWSSLSDAFSHIISSSYNPFINSTWHVSQWNNTTAKSLCSSRNNIPATLLICWFIIGVTSQLFTCTSLGSSMTMSSSFLWFSKRF